MSPRGARAPRFFLLALLALATACAPEDDALDLTPRHDAIASASADPAAAAAAPDDGLAEAYSIFRTRFLAEGRDQAFPLAFGYHPGLSTARLTDAAGQTVVGTAVLRFDEGRVTADLRGAPADAAFDLYFVKNVDGPGRSVRPEPGDQIVKVGEFGPSPLGADARLLDAPASPAVLAFDLDQVVVSLRGFLPTSDVVATGARTLLEKRFFRTRAGLPLDPVTGPLLTSTETTDPLVARGAELFFHETFGGNGRTCGTCHRAEENLTLTPSLIATLPADDPLFVAETQPQLAQLENSLLLRHDALIKENVDGFTDPNRFVLRGVPHTLALSTSNGTGDPPVLPATGTPPDFRLGWSGDGAPGRGSLNEFAFGAIVQHFPKDLARRVGLDFRAPTQAESDALEAFQLFSGRQHNPRTDSLTFREARAENGKSLFLGQAGCVTCHRDLVGGSENFLIDTDVERILIAAPRDGGFGVTGTDQQGGVGTGRFNVPPLVEAADTAPYFHNNTILTLEEAVAFYTTDVFFFSPARALTGTITLTQAQIDDVGAFLRVINAAENLRQIRKRTQFVVDHRSAGNDDLLRIALADADDAIADLEPKNLNPGAVWALKTARQTLAIALANPDSNRAAFASNALIWLAQARSDLFTANPLGEF
jgi:hypothetical protein